MGGSDSTGENQATATATARESAEAPSVRREPYGHILPVLRDSEGAKDLIQVHIWTPQARVREAPDHFYCLDMESEEFESVIQWARSARHANAFEDRRLPIIIVIGPGHSLTPQESYLVNHELTPSGVYFFRRPDDDDSFESAMKSLRDELVRQYGRSESRDAWRRNSLKAEPLFSK